MENNYTILLIDDDRNIILLAKDYLEFRGYEIFTANNGKEALDLMDKKSFDLIVCDVMMPEMDGYTFVEEIRKNPETNFIPVIFLSGKGQSEDRIKGLNVGADIYMIKPFEPEELEVQIASTLKQITRLNQHRLQSDSDISLLEVPQNIKLTATETKVVFFVAQGMSNKDIAHQIQVSQRTIESHVSNMLNKTGLHNRTELAIWFKQKN